MGLEKKHQDEVYRTLSRFGWAEKQVHDAMPCPHCHKVMHPFKAGYADYYAIIDSEPWGLPVMIEMKADKERFKFSDLREDQRQFLADWQKNSRGYSFLWLQLGDKKVNAKSPFRRQAWMMEYNKFLAVENKIIQATGLGYIPINAQAIETYNMRFKETKLVADVAFKAEEMEYISSMNAWRPNISHSIYEVSNIQYEQFNNSGK